MSKLVCPFCGGKLVKWMGYADCRFWTCDNVLCEAGKFGHIADECIWQALIDTKKKLDVAVDAIDAAKTLADIAGFKMLVAGLEKALEQINQKEEQ